MKNPKRVLLLGAGGMGMAPLALYLQGAGIQVEAYDDRFREPLRSNLENAGIHVLCDPTPLENPDCVIRTSAIPQDSKLVKPWLTLEVPVFRRGEFLAHFTAKKNLLAVVGSHGKTTTVGMLCWALRQVEFSFSYLVGGVYADNQFPPGRFDKNSWLVLEVDESDGTIDLFNPTITLALNCEWDHVDLYDSKESMGDVFKALFSRTSSNIITPVGSELSEWAQIEKGKKHSNFELNEDLSRYHENNLAAVIEAGHALGVDLSEVDFDQFPGIARRQSILHQGENRTIVEDYAHHPTEINAFLSHRRLLLPKHSLQVVFQPHRFTRTQAMAEKFADELAQADDLHFLPTYAAFEKFDPSGSVENLIGYLPPRLRKRTNVFSDFSQLCDTLGVRPDVKHKDQVLFVGAGDLEKWAHAFAAWENANGQKLEAFSHFLTNKLSTGTILKADEPLANKTTIGVGGLARWYAEPANSEDLRSLVEACNLFNISRAMMGRGSNLIVPDDGFGGLVIRLRGNFWKEISSRSENSLVVGAGAKLKDICTFACINGLSGFEFLEGIPGTLGGALRMNAGAMGWETFDLVEWVSFLLPDGTIKEIPGTDLNVGYRYCREAYDGIALRAKLKSDGKSDHREIRNAIEKLAKKRRASQPREASAGCIFRNPEEVSAGWLIEQSGLKGESEGAAVVSDKHANFILNQGGATADDVISLINRVRERIRESNGLILEPEVTLMGKSWNEYLS
ncbi:MAG: UDP-N-acetylmuramate dehydrogenase [Opitutae bacterium]|jgi:UDP-N-acetylmuramate--alanine ligase|nr:UDP-N-acetylmuramate dehydrogenase [Opitutae bacterium]